MDIENITVTEVDFSLLFYGNYIRESGPGSSVGIATDYGLEGLGI